MTDTVYAGSKIALICKDELVAYLRDDKESIPFPGFWDLPGGGREGDETPEQCALRELEEEFALVLSEDRIHWRRRYENQRADGLAAYFFVAKVRADEIASIQFGDEGQYLSLIHI